MTEFYSKISSDSSESSEEIEDNNVFKKLLTISQSNNEKRKYSAGRRREKEIHNYFGWDECENKSSCKIKNCQAKITGKRPSNLETHLRAFHRQEYGKCLEKDNKRKCKKLKTQPKITLFGSKLTIKKYERNHPIVKGFMLKLVKLIATTSIPVSIVVKNEFRDLIWHFDPKIPFPNTNGMINEIKEVFETAKSEIKNKIKTA